MRTRDKLKTALLEQAEKAPQEKAAAYRALAERAATGEFDDYSDVHICGPTALYNLCQQYGLDRFARRVAAGEFDATDEESEEWARSQTDPQMIALLESLGIGPNRSRDN